MIHPDKGLSILSGNACGPVVAMEVGLSFWGGVDPGTGVVIDVHHKQHGAALPGAIVLMPTSRGSCSGSGVLLELALCKAAPAALIFSEPEDTLTLGAIVAAEMFGVVIPVLRLPTDAFAAVATAKSASIFHSHVEIDGVHIDLERPYPSGLTLQPSDRAMIDGAHGPAVSQAMRILSAMALQQGAAALTDVTRAHIDGCIYAGPANLIFAETMERLGARVRIPATMNAISVDQENWQWQGVPTAFGEAAARLADSYVSMGCDPTFTCAPYLLDDAPSFGEPIGWSESNAVIFANSVLGARSAKHPDFLDLCIALTGRAPLTGVFLDENRRARCIIDVEFPADADPAVWPLIGYVAGLVAPDCVPLIRGVAGAKPTQDDLKALCAAFGTTSAAPMIHIEGVTPEAADGIAEGATYAVITRERLAESWMKLNDGLEEVDLVAIGSPHASIEECRVFAVSLAGRYRDQDVRVMVTLGRQVRRAIAENGTLAMLAASGVDVIADLCWCSITRPVFPVTTRVVMTTSGKYAHYGPGLSGCAVRLGTLDDCVEAALTGRVPPRRPQWL